MKYIAGLFIVCLFCLQVNAQKGKIPYYFPDSVEISLNNYLIKQEHNVDHYLVLQTAGKDTFKLTVCQYQKKQKKNIENWVFLTNRKAVVGNRSYPLLFDYDYSFSITRTSGTGVYGNRSNQLGRLIPILHGYTLKFTKLYILNTKNERIGYSNKVDLE